MPYLMYMPFKRTHFQLTQKPSIPHSTSASAYILEFEEKKCQLLMGIFFFFFTQDYSSFLVLDTTSHVRPKSGQGRGDYGAKSRLTLQTPASLLIYKWSEGFDSVIQEHSGCWNASHAAVARHGEKWTSNEKILLLHHSDCRAVFAHNRQSKPYALSSSWTVSSTSSIVHQLI